MNIQIRAILVAAALSAGLVANAAPPSVAPAYGYWRLGDGRYLFVRAPDAAADAPCTDACAAVWEPLLATERAVAGHGWTIEQQTDGRKLWAYNGAVVYALINPARNGYTSESALWLFARVEPWYPPGVTVGEFGLLAKTDGGKLRHIRYATCDEECKTYWRPMPALSDATDVQDWSIIMGEDGAKVWATGPDKWIVYEQQPGTTPPPPMTNPNNALGLSSMVGINAFPAVAITTPIAVTAGAHDVHDLDVTRSPKLAPGATAPQYPAASRRAGERGGVALQVCIDADGMVTSHTLSIASPFSRLNEATTAWAPTLKFIPGEVNGAPAATCGYQIVFDWTLS